MDHMFKQQSLQTVLRYNVYLLILCVCLSIATVFLSVCVFSREERWVLIPAREPDSRLPVLANRFTPTYLEEWALYVVRTLMTTNPDMVETQMNELIAVSKKSTILYTFFKEHAEFIKGSKIQSCFFPKNVTVTTKGSRKGIKVQGSFRYWIGSKKESVVMDKTFFLTYALGLHGVILLKTIENISCDNTGSGEKIAP